MGWFFNSGPSNAHWSPTKFFDHLKGLEDFFNQRSVAVNIGSSFFWKEALITSYFGWYFFYIWKSKTLLHLQALMLSDGILLNLEGVTGDAVISNVFPLRHLFSVGTRLWCLRRVLPQKMVENSVKLVFFEGFKDDSIPRFCWPGDSSGATSGRGGPPVECRLLGDTHHDERDPCVAVVLSLRIWRELAKPFSLQYKRTQTLGFGTGWMLSLLRYFLFLEHVDWALLSTALPSLMMCIQGEFRWIRLR